MGLGRGTGHRMLCPAMVLSGLMSSLKEMFHALKITRVTFLRYSRAAGKKEINHSIQFKTSIGRKQYKKQQIQDVLGPSWAFGCSHLTVSPTLHWVWPRVIPQKGGFAFFFFFSDGKGGPKERQAWGMPATSSA